MKLGRRFFFLIICLFTFLFSFQLAAQKKVRYKNIYPLLQSKDYASATADLLIFLTENDDEANAFYYLGEIIREQLDTTSIYPTAHKFDSLVDAAVDAYKTSIKLIDEKEVRKNDEYYMAYNRRDLRTGKFGIKVSDVHLDYENKITALESKKRLVSELHELQEATVNHYDALANKIKSIADKYPDKESFFLRLNEGELNIFEEVFLLFETFGNSIKTYRDKLDQLNHPLYQLTLYTKKIDNWDDLYLAKIDFSKDQLVFLDYQDYFGALKKVYTDEIIPLKTLLIEADDSLSEAIILNKQVADSTGIRKVTFSANMLHGLEKHMSTQLIKSLLEYKLKKAEVSTLQNATLFPVLNDTLNFYLRADKIERILEEYKNLNKVLLKINESRNKKSEIDLSFYLKNFKPSFNEWLRMENIVVEKEISDIEMQNDSLQEKVKYILYESDTLYMPDYAEGKFAKRVQHIVLSDSNLVLSGIYEHSTFMASAGFDMQLTHLTIIDSTSSISQMLPLQKQFLISAEAKDSLSFKNMIIYFDKQAKPIWQFKYNSADQMYSAKMQAGILFIYNDEKEIFLTLNKEGQQIGN